MEKSQLERKIQKKVAVMFSGLEQDLDIQFPEKLKIKFSDSLCVEAENLIEKNLKEKEQKAQVPQKKHSKQSVSDKINELISDRVGLYPFEVKQDANLKDDLGFDSLERIELILLLEKEFGLSIKDEEFDDVKIVEDVHALVLKKMKF